MAIGRRGFLGHGAALAAGLAAPAPVMAMAGAAPARQFVVTTTVDLGPDARAVQLWLPLFETDPACQRADVPQWQGDAAVTLWRDPRTGAALLHARWDARQPGARRLVLSQRLATWERSPPVRAAGPLPPAARALWTAPAPGIPTDGIVRDTARAIIGARRDPKEQLRAIYDWVVAQSWRDPAVRGCGTGDVAAMLTSGRLGGKCADISSLMVALCRAAGLPARDVYGLRLAPSALFPSLGRGGDVTGAQHCRAEAWIDGAGWLAVDPADVRKAILEEGLAPDSAPVRALGERLFGAWESNWGAYNSATGLALPGASHKPDAHFLMYPAGEHDGMVCDCLDPPRFAYRIDSREIPA
ncbi:MAG: transglutaminase domain-containing protein [Sphingomonadales bacterium]|nr:transglutaminase domain-containing protein [Sphingomonadales bacterium]